MDLDNIRLLEQVVKLGSVQRAATVLEIPRSTLRRKLEELAAEVGSELVVATATGVTLTSAGAVVLEQGRALLDGYARMMASARAPAITASGRIRCIVPTGIPELARLVLLQSLQAVAPELCVDELECAEPLDHLDEPFELMFHFGPPPTRGRWFSRTLRRLRLVPAASEAYLATHGRPSTVAELASHRLLAWRIGRATDPMTWPRWDGGSVSIAPACISGNGQILHHAAQQGLGIILADLDMPLHDKTPLVPVLDDQIGCEIAIRCLSPVPADHDPRTRALLETLHRFLALDASST